MSGIEFCESCGAPLMISRDLRWEKNGVISIPSAPANRMIMFECEPIDGLFKGIEELIGLPIEHIVVESRSRETRRLTQRTYPVAVRKILDGKGGRPEGEGLDISSQERETLLSTMRAITESLVDRGRIFGYGDQHLGELWDEGRDYPWRKLYLSNPYSLLFQAADNLGWVEAFEGADMWVRYGKTDEERHVAEVYPSEHPVDLQERAARKEPNTSPGISRFDRCVECGIPLDVARHQWNADRGTITDPDTGRRIAIFDPASMDGIFDDLQSELGEAIQSTVIEAMKGFVKEGWELKPWSRPPFSFQKMFSVRGLGKLVSFKGNRDRVSIIIENACLHLCVVGMMQALTELAYRLEGSDLDWQLGDDNMLSITVSRVPGPA